MLNLEKILSKYYGEDDPNFVFNKVIDEFWDYDGEAKAKAIEISHSYAEVMKSGVSSQDVIKANQNKKTKKPSLK